MASQRKLDKLSKENDGPPEVVNLLVSMFGGVLSVAIIKSVGFNCQWNVDSASNILAELSSSVGGDNVKPKWKKKSSSSANVNTVSYGTPAEAEDDDDADVLIENDTEQQSESHNSIPWLERSNSTNPFRRDEPVASNNPFRVDRRPARLRNKTPTGRNIPTGRHTPVAKPGPGVPSARNIPTHLNYGAAVVKVPPPAPVNRAQPPKPLMHVQNKSKKEIELDRVREHIRSGAKVLVILRGLPGSGKSHLARLIVTTTINEDPQRFIYSTDEYFMRNGTYQFNATMLGDAHEWNKRRVYEAMMLGMSPIVVDNTNTEMWEMKPYAGFAVQYGYAVEIMEPLTVWIFNPPDLARRNIHGVPRAKIESMLERYEKKITPEKLFSIYGLHYNPKNIPPQPRLYPPMSRNIRPLFAIPAEIVRNPTVPPNPNSQPLVNGEPPSQAAKKKKKKKKKTAAAGADGQTSETSSTISKSESMHSILTNDDSSDAESDSGNNPYGSNRDLLSEDFGNESNDYVLISPQNGGAHYQQLINAASQDNIDLINFNDLDEVDDKHTYSNDLINLENRGTQRQATASISEPSSSSVREMTARLIDSCEAILKSVTSAANKPQPTPVTDFPQIDLSAWQTTKEALASWELVDEPQVKIPPLKKHDEPQPQRHTARQIPSEYSSTKSDSTTNTTSADFNLLKEECHATADYRVVPTSSRVIGELYPSPLPRSPTRVHVLDKSTMTGQENLLAAALSRTRCTNADQHFTELLHLFPKARKDVLKEMFDKCGGDINWAVDLLLDCNPDTLESASDNNEQQQQMDISWNIDPSSQHVHSAECNCASEYETQLYVSEPRSPVASASVMSSPEIKKIAKQKPEISEEILQLKRQFENQFKIDDTHYSGYLLNVRNRKHGDPMVQPSTSREDASTSSAYSMSDIVPEPPIEGDSEESSEDEMIEMNVGANFVEELQRTFGGDDLEYPQGLQPVMSLPASLLRQLHAYWLESVYQQMEVQSAIIAGMVREDEEFARKLQEKEATGGEQQPVVPDLQEIMDMEIALAIYRTDQEQWKKETPDDLASRMKRQKLFDTFPNLDKAILVEILQAHNNSFEQTCEVLMASVGQEAIQLDEAGEIRTATGCVELQKQKELIEKAKTEYIQAKKLENATPKTAVVKQSSSGDEASDSCSHEDTAEYYRTQAAHHLKMRQQCFNKAQAAFQKGSTQVAMYYSDIAKMHIQKYEQANSLAASAFLSAHSMKQQNSKTLDLHFLYVKEAQQALALFIDNQLSKLKENNKPKETLFIITGRGRNSRDGVAHIKLAVKRCLKDRHLEFVEMNPGLLKVTIKRHSKMTNDLK